MSADTVPASPTAASPAPRVSIRRPVRTEPGATPRSSSSVTTAAGTVIQKTHRQDRWSTSTPPTNGPMSPAMPEYAVHRPIARPCASPSNADTIIASELGTSSAPPTPWTARAATRTAPVGAIAQAADATANPTRPAASTRRRP